MNLYTFDESGFDEAENDWTELPEYRWFDSLTIWHSWKIRPQVASGCGEVEVWSWHKFRIQEFEVWISVFQLRLREHSWGIVFRILDARMYVLAGWIGNVNPVGCTRMNGPHL
jgi:hypothetical protein